MSAYLQIQTDLRAGPKQWLLTGAAGFIGSHILETLLRLGQRVVGLDNFSTGYQANLDEVRALVTPEEWGRFEFIEGDIRDLDMCRRACRGAEVVCHQAALGSVPRSFADPLACHSNNVTGTLNLLAAARDAEVARFVYVSSSAVYGDEPRLPKVEDRIGRPLSPYASSKLMNEMYADIFARSYGLQVVGLRCFNVYGPRQDPDSSYAAVIPQWSRALLRGETVCINGDGETSRDFCYVANVVQANLLAACAAGPDALNQVYNIALGQRTTLNELFRLLQQSALRCNPALTEREPVYREFRKGDVRHSLADISKAGRLLGYAPTHANAEGLELAVKYYQSRLAGPGR